MKKACIYILLILFLPLSLLLADETTKKSSAEKVNMEKTIEKPNVEKNVEKSDEKKTQLVTLKPEDSTNEIEDTIKKRTDGAKKIIEDLNKGKFTKRYIKSLNFEKDMNYLKNKINVNKQFRNELAVIRDEIKLIKIEEEKEFLNTLQKIIEAKNLFKEKDYYVEILEKNIENLQKNSPDRFKQFYEQEKNNKGKISKKLTENYLDLLEQNTRQLFTLRYMLGNMNLYRTTNFFIDEFNLKYVVSQIDSLPVLSSITKFTSYYYNFSMGDIVVVLFILVFFRLIAVRLARIFVAIANKIFVKLYLKAKNSDDIDADMKVYIKSSIEKPLIFAIYVLSVQLSIYIIIEDIVLLNKIMPWINTIYMGIATWAVYSLISNIIVSVAQNLVEKYPNVRKEMIVFILKIIKIILITLVIMFLFTQLGLDIKAIIASLGVGGIAIALASKDTLENFFGSITIMADNSFSQGDWIVTNNVEGTVVDIRMRSTRIRTFDNAMITVPNSELANSPIKNYSKRKIGRRIKMSLGITYESKMEDIVNLKKDIEQMLQNHPLIANNKISTSSKAKKFEAIKREDLQGVKKTLLVYIDEYADSSINILIYCFSRSPVWDDWLATKEDVIVKIHELVKKNNCDIAYPSQTLFLKK